MNQLTHWLDASNIYGSDDREAQLLRSKSGGKLRVTTQGNEDLLPVCRKNSEILEEMEVCHSQPPECGKN